jgi:hypothetical protein
MPPHSALPPADAQRNARRRAGQGADYRVPRTLRGRRRRRAPSPRRPSTGTPPFSQAYRFYTEKKVTQTKLYGRGGRRLLLRLACPDLEVWERVKSDLEASRGRPVSHSMVAAWIIRAIGRPQRGGGAA